MISLNADFVLLNWLFVFSNFLIQYILSSTFLAAQNTFKCLDILFTGWVSYSINSSEWCSDEIMLSTNP